MLTPTDRRGAPGKERPATSVTTTTADHNPDALFELHQRIADACGLSWQSVGFLAVVTVAEGRTRRQPYLSLAAAHKAVQRAHNRGAAASVQIVELRPILGGAL